MISGSENGHEVAAMVHKYAAVPDKLNERDTNSANHQKLPSVEDQQIDAGQLNMQRTFTIPRKPLPECTYSIVSLDEDDSTPRVDKELLSWRPFYLRTPVLLAFIISFSALIVTLEVVLRISERDQGLVAANEHLHYLWKYGPSTVFIILAALWARVEYQVKDITPWSAMTGTKASAETSVLLDYVSTFQPVAIYKAYCNRHYVVASVAIGSLLFKVLIVASSALLDFSFVAVTHEDTPVIVSSTFSRSVVDLNRTGTIPYLMLDGVQRLGLPYPPGVTTEIAYQSFHSETLPEAIITTNVEAIWGQLECKEAEMTVSSWYRQQQSFNDSGLSSSSVRQDGLMQLSVDDCQASNILLGTATRYFAMFRRAWCDSNVTGSDRSLTQRIALIAAESKAEAPNITTTVRGNSSGTVTSTNYTIVRSKQYLCIPKIQFTTAAVTINQSRIGEAASYSLVGPDSSSRTDDVSGLDIARILFDADNDDSSLNPLDELMENFTQRADTDMGWPYIYGMRLAGNYNATVEPMLQGDLLLTSANNYLGAIVAFIAQSSLSQPAQISSTASAQSVEGRIQVQSLSVRVIQVTLGITVGLTICIAVCATRFDILPHGASTILGVASLLLQSQLLTNRLKTTGRAPLPALDRLLDGHQIISGVVKDGLGSYFRVQASSQLASVPLKSSHTSKDTNENPKGWQPFTVVLTGRLCACIILLTLIIVAEVLLQVSMKKIGLTNMVQDGYARYIWFYVPATILILVSLWFSAIDFDMKCLGPYLNLRRGSLASTTIGITYLDEVSITTLLRSIHKRHWAVFTTSLAAVVGSTLTIAVSGLYLTSSTTWTSQAQLFSLSKFSSNLTYDGTFSLLLGEYGTSVAGLILHRNLTYPAWTYNELAFPQLRIMNTDDSKHVSLDENDKIEVRARVSATRVKMACKFYDTDYSVNHSPQGKTINFIHNFTNLGCYAGQTWGHEVLPNTYFGFHAAFRPGIGNPSPNEADCFQKLYLWGSTTTQNVSLLYALGCNETINDVDVDVTFAGSKLAISNTHPPVEDVNTLRPSSAELVRDALKYTYQFWPKIKTPKESSLDEVFQTIVYGTDGIPIEYLGQKDKTEALIDRLKHVHYVYRAQWLNEISRITLNDTMVQPQPLNATVTHFDRARVVQDLVATRILQGLLALMLVCTIVAIILSDTRDVLPKNPCSIAAKASLLADSSLITGRVLPRGAEWASEAELNSLVEGKQFRMGWFSNDSGGKVYTIDLHEPEAAGPVEINGTEEKSGTIHDHKKISVVGTFIT